MRGRPVGHAATWSICMLVAGLPLAVSPTVSDPVLPLRLVVLSVGLALGMFAPGEGRLPLPLVVSVATGLAVFVVAAAAGATPLLSLLGRFPRYEGLPVVLGYAAALVVGARLLGADRARLREHALRALVVVVIVNAIVAAVQLAGTPDARVTGTLGNSTTLGTFALLTIALVATGVTGRDGWRWAGLGAAAFCLVVSASRGALLGAVVAGLALIGVRLAARLRRRWWEGPLFAAGALALAVLAPGSRARITGSTPFAEATIGGRVLLWQETADLVAAHPVLGAGPSRFVDSIGAFHSVRWAVEVGPYAPPDSPHDVVLQVAASTGLLGVVAVGGIVVTVVGALWRARPWDAWQVGVVLAGIAATTSYLTSFTDSVTTSVLLLFVGGAVSAPQQGPSRQRRPAERTGAALALVLGLGLGGSALVAEGRYAAAVAGSADATTALLAVPGVRPWDADLARRVGYSAARLAESGRATPAAFVARLRATCADLPGSVECLQTLGDLEDLSGDHWAALTTLNRARLLDPHNVDTMLRRGIALAELGRSEEAIGQFQRAATLRRTAPEPWDDLAALYDQLGRAGDAAGARATADALRRR